MAKPSSLVGRHPFGPSATQSRLLALPLEIRLSIYDHCLELRKSEAFFTPSTHAVSSTKFALESLGQVCAQIRNELMRDRRKIRTRFEIEGFPRVSACASDKFFQHLPFRAMLAQRLESVSIVLHRARPTPADGSVAAFNSLVRSIFVVEELAGLWTKTSSLRVLHMKIPDIEEEACRLMEMTLISVLDHLAKLRGLEYAEISGPGPFESEMAIAAVRLMVQGRERTVDTEIKDYELQRARYLHHHEPKKS